MRDQQNSENRLGAGGGRLRTIGTVGDRGRRSDRLPRLLGRVAEWQTRWLQVPVSFGTWGFKSPFAHNQQFYELIAPAGDVHLAVVKSNVARAADAVT
jgi:hypothetical protein